MNRGKRDQAYMDRLRSKIERYQQLDAARLHYIRKLQRHCRKHGIGVPMGDEMEDVMREALAKYRRKQEGAGSSE